MAEQSFRDPETAARIAALGPSKKNPDVEAAMRGEKGKRPAKPKICSKCGKPLGPNHKSHIQGRSTAEKIDRGEPLVK